MANYYGTSRTNYFRVKNEAAYQKLYAGLCAEDTIEDFTEVRDGITWHGFGSYSPITFMTEDDNDCEYDGDYDICAFLEGMKDVIADDDAFMYFESGYEKLRYVTGFAYVVTKSGIDCVDIEDWAVSKAKAILGDSYTTRTNY